MKKVYLHNRLKRSQFIISAISTAVLITISVFLVFIANKIPWQYDMTIQRIFTLSGQTHVVLDSVSKPIQIAGVYPSGEEEMMVKSLLDEYVKASGRISVEYVDAEQEPAKLAKYQLSVSAVPNGTLIIKCGDRVKLIDNASLFEDSTDGQLFNGEREITGAIRYVSSDILPVIYFVQGHEEADPASVMTKAVSALQQDACEVKELKLLQQGGVPQDAAVVVIASPKADLTSDELAYLDAYLRQGGKMLLLVDAVMNTNDIVLGNLNGLTNEFGIDITNNYVVEEDSSFYLSNQKLYIIPGFGPHEITAGIAEAKKMVILPVARGLGEIEQDKSLVERSALLMSSDKSWIRSDMTNTSTSKTETDMMGPIALAYASTRSNVQWGEEAARIVVIGNSSFAYDGNIQVQANRDLFTNIISWLLGDRGGDVISSKIINAGGLIIRGNDFTKLAIICLAVMPGLAFLAAFAVWLLRKNK